MWKKKKTRKRNKYGNKKVEGAPGHWFDSILEKALFNLLSLRQRAGEIQDLTHHPGTVFLSDARIAIRPDFRFTNCKTKEVEYAESKGFADNRWPVKKKLWKSYGPGKLEIWMTSERSLKLIETISPKSKSTKGERMENGKYVIVRTYAMGVFAGTLEVESTETMKILTNARRIWYWAGAASLSQLAVDGTSKPEECKFPCEVSRVELTSPQGFEVLTVTPKARESIASVKEWKF